MFFSVMQDIRSTLVQELDFENEAANMNRCRRDLAVFPWLHVPEVHKALSSKRVLTAEWIDGCRVTDKIALEKMGLSRADVSRCGRVREEILEVWDGWDGAMTSFTSHFMN